MDFTASPTLPAIAAVIPGKAPVTSISYHEDGKRLFVASSADHKLQVIDCLNGRAAHVPLKCERESLSLVEATHHDHNVLIAGKGSSSQPAGQRNAISYWSTFDNKILRKFRGHSDEVRSLSMCPASDTFLSSSNDRTVRLWNVQQAGCLAELKLPSDKTAGAPLAVFDSTGLVFAASAAMAGGQGHYVHLYDARNHEAGAFCEFKIAMTSIEESIVSHTGSRRAAELARSAMTSLEFNLSGSQILAGFDNGLALVINGYEGHIERVVAENNGAGSHRPAVVAFTPDDRTILCGNEDGSIDCWDFASGTRVKHLTGHASPVTCVAANPKFSQLASTCSQTALWLW